MGLKTPNVLKLKQTLKQYFSDLKLFPDKFLFSLKNPEEFFLGKIKNKKSHNSMYLRGTMTKWDAGKSVKMQKIKDVRYGDSFVWYCDVFLQKGRYEFKFDVRNDWTISYGSDIGEVGINSVGKIFNVFNTFDVVNNLTIDIPYSKHP